MNKYKISDLPAMHVIIAIAEALGRDINYVIINRSKLRQRELNRIKKQQKLEMPLRFSFYIE